MTTAAVIGREAGPQPGGGYGFIKTALTEWRDLRAVLRRAEQLENPPFTDGHGREWTWWKGDLWCHDQLAFPLGLIGVLRLPNVKLRDNPNYDLCAICTQEWARMPDAEGGPRP